MAYFSPYIDASGLHMPTYEDRLEDLAEAYRNIFGTEAELSPSVPDYQLLSVFARVLDDVTALLLQAYNSRNPMYAAGASLDLLLPQYGISRTEGETDAEVRARIRHALAAKGSGSKDALLAALKSLPYVRDALVYVNDTETTDSTGLPSHSLGVVVRGGYADAVAQAIYDKKAPGIGTWGSSTGHATDAQGHTHGISFTRYTDRMIFVYLFIRVLDGGDRTRIENAVVPAVLNYIDNLGLAVPLNVPQLYGVAYTADLAIADTFIVTDIQVAVPGSSSVVRDEVPCDWNGKITAIADGGVEIRFS